MRLAGEMMTTPLSLFMPSWPGESGGRERERERKRERERERKREREDNMESDVWN